MRSISAFRWGALLLQLLLFPLLETAAAASPPARADTVVAAQPDSVFQVGEELTYNVSYASFDIGQVRIKLLSSAREKNRTTYRATAYIDSYKGVPLVNLHAVYENIMDQTNYSMRFEARHKDSHQWISEVYRFDYPRKTIIVDQGPWKSPQIEQRDTLRIDTLSQDGLSVFYLARHDLFSPRRIDIPTVVNRKKGTTHIAFPGERTKEEIEAVKYPIDLIHFEGEAGFVGIFGLTGGFEGWFSNDAARVPIIAKMKVLIGNVRIELVSWKRAGWVPPRAPDEESR